jgi:predicted aldo/keto reductase-like oxidoreductase
MANNCVKKCPTSLDIKEMKSKQHGDFTSPQLEWISNTIINALEDAA